MEESGDATMKKGAPAAMRLMHTGPNVHEIRKMLSVTSPPRHRDARQSERVKSVNALCPFAKETKRCFCTAGMQLALKCHSHAAKRGVHLFS